MHELGLLTGVVAAVNQAASGRQVTAVDLVVGAQAGVVREALESSWPLARRDECAGADLRIRWVPAQVWCPQCSRLQPIDEYFALTCPACGTPTADLRTGKEFTVESIDVETDPSA